jgi:hypothetical protein
MQAILRVSLLLSLSAVAVGQSDRQAIEHYEANFEKYLGKDITLMVARAERQDKGENSDVAIFRTYTLGQRDSGYTDVVVPRSETESFAKRYAFRDYNTRPLRGTFMATTNGNFYISYKGALFPGDAVTDAAPDSEHSEDGTKQAQPAYDDSPMTSFSYGGARIAEARIVSITPDTVRLTGKDETSIDVPLERAVKMPDLRMRAKDAMEAALAQAQNN